MNLTGSKKEFPLPEGIDEVWVRIEVTLVFKKAKKRHIF
jgi:hypothetical protein